MADKTVVSTTSTRLAPAGHWHDDPARAACRTRRYSLALMRFLDLRGVFGDTQGDLATLGARWPTPSTTHPAPRGSVAVFEARVT